MVAVFAFASGQNAQAESFREQVDYGNALLNSGDFEGAREVYRNLQIEHPENEIVYYSLGCVDYEEGESVSALEDPEGAIEFFTSAREAFQQATTSREESIRVDAAYNHANSVAQIAKHKASLGDQQATITAFEESVQAYEELLDRYPDHEKARHNLDHMRYLLKRMLQNPPKNDEQSEGEQGQQEKEKQDQQQQNQQQQQNENGEGEQQEGEQTEQNDAQSEEEQSQEANEQEQQAQEQQQATASVSEENTPESDEDMKDRQTIEAILQSLEAQDKREQQELRTSMPDSHIRREWW